MFFFKMHLQEKFTLFLLSSVVEDLTESETPTRPVSTPKVSKAENHGERDKSWGWFKGLAGIFRYVLSRDFPILHTLI